LDIAINKSSESQKFHKNIFGVVKMVGIHTHSLEIMEEKAKFLVYVRYKRNLYIGTFSIPYSEEGGEDEMSTAYFHYTERMSWEDPYNMDNHFDVVHKDFFEEDQEWDIEVIDLD
jgi:hypothetical protein